MTLDNRFYVLTARGDIFIAGVIGVFSTEDKAREAAEDQQRKSDGFHSFMIESVRLDTVYDGEFCTGLWSGRKPTTKPPSIEVDVR